MDTKTIPTVSGAHGRLLSMIGETGVEPVTTLMLISMMKETWKKETGKDKVVVFFVRREDKVNDSVGMKCNKMTTVETEAIDLCNHWLSYGIPSDIVKVEI
jgi:hypothetical protein